LTRVLVTGAAGQLGTELVRVLRARHGAGQVLATDLRSPSGSLLDAGPFRTLDCTDPAGVASALADHAPDRVYHLAALLSAVGERRPTEAFRVNLGGLTTLLEAARERSFSLFHPSSIAVFGPETPAALAPQDTILRPTTMYGITKVTGELLCDYYHRRYGVDARGLRYPGLISHSAPPGGGTTDFAVEIFRAASAGDRYICPIAPDTRMEMMYMPDAVRAALEVMEVDPDALRHRNAFNLAAIALSPRELADAIRLRLPGFEVEYEVDPVLQGIADSWPRRVDDSEARRQWGWRPEFDLDTMVDDMLENLREPA